MISAPVEGHFQVGKAERRIQIIKKSFEAITEQLGTTIDHHQRLALALIARNLTPTNGTNAAPITALTGRVNTLDDSQWAPLTKHDVQAETQQYTMWKRLGAIKFAQAAILRFDADRSIRLCLQRNLQVSANDCLKPNDEVDAWIPKKKRRAGAYRVLYDSGRNVVLEGNGVVFKHARNWCRLRQRSEVMVQPFEDTVVGSSKLSTKNFPGDQQASSSSHVRKKKSPREVKPDNPVILETLEQSPSPGTESAFGKHFLDSRITAPLETSPDGEIIDYCSASSVDSMWYCGISAGACLYFCSSVWTAHTSWQWDWCAQIWFLDRFSYHKDGVAVHPRTVDSQVFHGLYVGVGQIHLNRTHDGAIRTYLTE